MDAAPQFIALNGFEMKAAILAKIEEALTRTGEFEQNRTFPWVKLIFNVGLTVYPKQSVDAAPGIVALGSEESPGAPDSTDDSVKKHIEVSTEEVIDTPNITRIETGQGIPTPILAPGGVIVDKPVVPPAPKPPVEAVSKEKNSGTGSGTTKPVASGNANIASADAKR